MAADVVGEVALARPTWKFLWLPASQGIVGLHSSCAVWNKYVSQSRTEAHAARMGPKTLRLITMINPRTPHTPRQSVLRCGKRERRIRRAAMVRRREWQMSIWLEGQFLFPSHMLFVR